MFGLSVQIKNEVSRVQRAANDAARRNVTRTAFLIFQTARASVVRAAGPSAPGQPPHTHRGNWLRRAIRYASERVSAVIGTAHSILGEAGSPHEHGGDFRGQVFPQRSFMAPALDKNLDVFANSWSGSIGE